MRPAHRQRLLAGHGLARQMAQRKIAAKTVTRRLTAEQAERYHPWFENNRRLRELISELEALSLQAAEHAEGWGEK